MKYDRRSVTDDGANLLAHSKAVGKRTVFGTLAITDNQPSQDVDNLTIDDLGNFLEFPISYIKQPADKTWQPSAIVGNVGISAGDHGSAFLTNVNNGAGTLNNPLSVNTVGIIAHTDGEDNNVLFAAAYANPGEAITVPSATDIPYKLTLDFAIKIDNNISNDDITIQVNNAGMVNFVDLQDVLQNYIRINGDGTVTQSPDFQNSVKRRGVELVDQNQLIDAINNFQIVKQIDPNADVLKLAGPLVYRSAWGDQNTLKNFPSSDGAATIIVYSSIAENGTGKVVEVIDSWGGHFVNQWISDHWSGWNQPAYKSDIQAGGATITDVNNAYQNAVNTAKKYAVQDNHDGTININGYNMSFMGNIDPNQDLFKLNTPGIWYASWGYQNTLKNFPSSDGAATIILEGPQGGGRKLTVLDSWGGRFVNQEINGTYGKWQSLLWSDDIKTLTNSTLQDSKKYTDQKMGVSWLPQGSDINAIYPSGNYAYFYKDSSSFQNDPFGDSQDGITRILSVVSTDANDISETLSLMNSSIKMHRSKASWGSWTNWTQDALEKGWINNDATAAMNLPTGSYDIPQGTTNSFVTQATTFNDAPGKMLNLITPDGGNGFAFLNKNGETYINSLNTRTWQGWIELANNTDIVNARSYTDNRHDDAISQANSYTDNKIGVMDDPYIDHNFIPLGVAAAQEQNPDIILSVNIAADYNVSSHTIILYGTINYQNFSNSPISGDLFSIDTRPLNFNNVAINNHSNNNFNVRQNNAWITVSTAGDFDYTGPRGYQDFNTITISISQ